MEQLPNEILEDIFAYMSPKTIKNCSLVCRRWNNIISDSREIMEKFELRMQGDENFEKYKAQLPLRNLQVIQLMYLSENSSLDIHHGYLTKLTLKSCKLKSQEFIRLINSHGTTLKRLFIDEVCLTDIRSLEPSERIHVQLHQLDISQNIRREIFNNVNDVVEVLTLFNITSLEEFGAGDIWNIPQITDFISRQSNLKKLYIWSQSRNDVFNQNFNKLTEFCFEGSIYDSFDFYREVIVRNSPIIKELFVDTNEINYDSKSILKELPVNTHVKRIYLSSQWWFDAHLIFLSKFCNLEELYLEIAFTNDMFKTFHSYMPNLKSLEYSGDHPIESQDVYIPKLQKVKLKYGTHNFFNDFIPRHAETLQELKIDKVLFHMNKDLLEDMLKCKKLRYVELGVNENFVTQLFQIVLPNSHQWTLKLLINSLKHKYRMIYHFPDDQSYFYAHSALWLEYLSKHPEREMPFEILEKVADDITLLAYYHNEFYTETDYAKYPLAAIRLLSTLSYNEIAHNDYVNL